MTYQRTATLRGVNLGKGLPIALLTAGPSFVAHLMIGSCIAKFPAAIPIDASAIAIALIAMIPAMIFGAVVALLPCLVGGLAMAVLSNHFPALRHPLAWTIAGAGIGLLFCLSAYNPGIETWVATTGTSALCGRLCRIGLH